MRVEPILHDAFFSLFLELVPLAISFARSLSLSRSLGSRDHSSFSLCRVCEGEREQRTELRGGEVVIRRRSQRTEIDDFGALADMASMS